MQNNDITQYFTNGLTDEIKTEGLRRIQEGEVAVLAFSGKKGSGKDTISSKVADLFQTYGYADIVEEPFAFSLKSEVTEIIATMDDILESTNSSEKTVNRIASIYDLTPEEALKVFSIMESHLNKNLVKLPTGWTRSEEVWELLRYFGTEVRQGQDMYYWVKKTFDRIATNAYHGKHTFINDLRFLNEAEPLKLLGAFTIRVDISEEAQIRRLGSRDGIMPTKEALVHRSEVELDHYTGFDYRFDNSLDGGLDAKAQSVFEIWENNY